MWYGSKMKLRDLAAAEAALQVYFGISEKTMGQDITLARMERLMTHLGNPELSLRIIHVAGTSGKTSTTYYIATLLQYAGLKVGHTVSPHVDSITERIQLNGSPISERQFCEYLGEFLDIVATAPEQPTWFELLVAFAYWVFAREQVDYAVIETGLGGQQDASNVAARTDKLCVITDIGLDHMHILGDTVQAIAYQKSGIIHEGNDVLMYDQSPEIMQVIRYWVSQQENAELYTFEQPRLERAYKGTFVKNLPQYQRRNWLLAFAAYLFVAKRDNLRILTATEMQKTQRILVPGRMDRRQIEGKTIVMDGAHNAQKMQAFIESFCQLYPDRKVPMLLALKQGKEVHDIAPLLARVASNVIVTTFSKMQDLPLVSIDPEEIVPVLREHGITCRAISDQHQAYTEFIRAVDDIGVITGSFFLLSQLRERETGLS